MRYSFALASLCMVCVLGISFRSYARSTAPPMGSHPIAPTNWGFECVYDTDCAHGEWIATKSQPGTVRLWDSGTQWSILNPAAGTYDWKNLDTWLDLIAEHQPRAVMFTFGHVPCWITSGECTNWNNWSPDPPSDLTSSGSPSFNAFVTALVQHCSPAGHCVKDYIKYWEMWNEANNLPHWTGTPTQLYDMFAPVIPIIRNNIPDAIVSTPPICGGDTSWMTSWMTLENTNGRLSDYYGFHVYLESVEPETRIYMVERMLATKNTNGWTTTPWMNTETNFINTTDTCSTQFTKRECQAQFVRWHVLQYALQAGGGGAFHVGWYNWETIRSGGYDTYYYTMMQWLTGATFTASCTDTDKGPVWTCPLTEANGTQALIVWNATGDSRYKPAPEFVDYKYFNGTYGGATKAISQGQATTIGMSPIMFESGN